MGLRDDFLMKVAAEPGSRLWDRQYSSASSPSMTEAMLEAEGIMGKRIAPNSTNSLFLILFNTCVLRGGGRYGLFGWGALFSLPAAVIGRRC